jgi:hypothetical protein
MGGILSFLVAARSLGLPLAGETAELPVGFASSLAAQTASALVLFCAA